MGTRTIFFCDRCKKSVEFNTRLHPCEATVTDRTMSGDLDDKYQADLCGACRKSFHSFVYRFFEQYKPHGEVER